MKLVFPNGEHGQVLLNPGVNRIGSSAEAAVMLTAPGVLPEHCTIHVTQTGANLQVSSSGGRVEVNGKPVTDLMALRAGDTLLIGPVQARYLIVEVAKSASVPSGHPDGPGHSAVDALHDHGDGDQQGEREPAQPRRPGLRHHRRWRRHHRRELHSSSR